MYICMYVWKTGETFGFCLQSADHTTSRGKAKAGEMQQRRELGSLSSFCQKQLFEIRVRILRILVMRRLVSLIRI